MFEWHEIGVGATKDHDRDVHKISTVEGQEIQADRDMKIGGSLGARISEIEDACLLQGLMWLMLQEHREEVPIH